MLPADGGATAGKGTLENGDRRWSTASSAEFGIARAYQPNPASSSMLADDELLPAEVSPADLVQAGESLLPAAVASSGVWLKFICCPWMCLLPRGSIQSCTAVAVAH